MKQSLRPATTSMVTKSLISSVSFLLAASAISLTLTACGQAKKNPQLPSDSSTLPTTKPDSRALAQVSLTTLSEITHLERAMKPYFSLDTSTVAGCTKKGTSTKAMWETTWSCGLDSTMPGKKEIEGIERLNFDRETRVLSYEAKFEVRNFEDVEPRSKAHTLITSRRIRVIFDKAPNGALTSAKVGMRSSATTVNGPAAGHGSEWTSEFNGTLKYVDTDWTLLSGSTIAFKGALFGVDGERKTAYASGEYQFVSKLSTTLSGLSSAGSCTKPVGTWRLGAAGGGGKIDTTLETTANGGDVSAGSTFAWPSDLCERP